MIVAGYRPYPKYSNVESFEQLPDKWSWIPLKHSVGRSITDGPHETPVFADSGIPFLSVDGIQNSKLVFEGCRFITEEDHRKYSEKCKPVRNDLLLGKAASVGKIAQVDTDLEFSVWSPLAVINPNSHISCSRFYFFCFQSCVLQYQCAAMSNSNTQKNLGMKDIENLQFPVPSLAEQQIIANFLDHETAKIDTLIEKQQQLIKLLNEKRQAVISHAVTKGLNSDAPMRDSGVEWLGEVPAHWTTSRLKFTSFLQSGIPKGKDLTGKKHIAVPMLRVANVQDGYLSLDDVHMMNIEPEQLDRYSLREGDVLMNEGGDNDKLGRGTVWNKEIDPCIHQNHVFAIRPFKVEPQWLDILTRAEYAKYHFYRVAKQSTNLASISSTNIKETPLLIPPSAERAEIIKYISEMTLKINTLIRKCESQVGLSKERRTALISAAVTGKIDVRNWQPPTSNKARPNKEATL